MKKIQLEAALKFRLENVDGQDIIFCYDERINEYFAMDAKYYSALVLLSKGITEQDLFAQQNDLNIDLLVRGLRYRKLVFDSLEE